MTHEEIEGAVISVFRAPPIQGLGNAGGFKFQIEQRGFVDLVALQKATDDIVRIGNTPPEARNPAEPGPRKLALLFTMFRAETPQLFIDIDRTKCESLQVDVADVFSTLQVYMGGAYVNLFNKFGRTWQVNVLAESKFRTQPEYLATLVVSFPKGEQRFRSDFPQWEPLAQQALFAELAVFISQLDLKRTVFRSDHASNALILKGTLGADKERLLAQVKQAIERPQEARLRPKWARGL